VQLIVLFFAYLLSMNDTSRIVPFRATEADQDLMHAMTETGMFRSRSQAIRWAIRAACDKLREAGKLDDIDPLTLTISH
jgi:Arc/MetJ-type ribon-helix-helix transcriptional regulator